MLKIKINKKNLEKAYFKNTKWIQLLIDNKFSHLDTIIPLLLELQINNKIKTWFVLQKNNCYKIKIEFCSRSDIITLLELDKIYVKKTNNNLFIDTYLPELFQFGGVVGWDIIKKYFNNISLLYFKNANKINTQNIAEVLLIDLLIRCVTDSWEIWDVYQRLFIIRDIQFDESSKEEELDELRTSPLNYYQTKINSFEIIKIIVSANKSMSQDLLTNKFDLDFEIRQILPFIIAFVFNILGISEELQKEIIKRHCKFLNPAKYPLLIKEL